MKWHLIVRQGYQGFHAILSDFINQFFIELQSFFIWFLIISIGIDPCPIDRDTKAVHAGFCQQFQILFIGMIEINAIALWIIAFFILQGIFDICCCRFLVGLLLQIAFVLYLQNIRNTKSFPTF